MQEAAATEVGQVAGWLTNRGIGFISAKGSSKDLFFSATVAREQPGQFVNFRIGDAVEFRRGIDNTGRPCATWVRALTGDK